MSNLIIILLMVAISGFGLFIIFKGLLGILYGSGSKKWPRIKGVIIKSDVISEETGSTTSHAAVVQYRYWVKQRSYVGERVGFSNKGSRFNASSNLGDANYISNQYPEGEAVEIYYHPRFHFFSVLEPGFSWWSLAVLIIGISLQYYPLMMLVKYINS